MTGAMATGLFIIAIVVALVIAATARDSGEK